MPSYDAQTLLRTSSFSRYDGSWDIQTGGVKYVDDDDDDAVSVAVKRIGRTFSICFVLWSVSYALTFFIAAVDGNVSPVVWALLFSPMWVGSVYGIISISRVIWTVCRKGTALVTREAHLIKKAIGENPENHMTYDSLPLMRRMLFWSSVLAAFILVSFCSQLCYFIWLVAGVIELWRALAPVLALLTLLLVYMFLVRTISIPTFLTLAWAFVAAVSF